MDKTGTRWLSLVAGLSKVGKAVAAMTQDRLKPCAFLDRDGVLNADTGYVGKISDVTLIAGAAEAVALLNARGYTVVVTTNQSGVARGLYGIEDVESIHTHLNDVFLTHGGHVARFYYCPFHPDAIVTAFAHPDHPDRKPNPGMIEKALRELPVTRAGSFLIGDKESDMEAARRAGIAGHLFAGGRLDTFVQAILDADAQT